MKKLKKLIAVGTTAALLAAPASAIADAHDAWAYDNGVAYYDSYGTSCLAPSIALGVIAAAAVIAVLVNNSNEGANHSHFHCN